jgi:hypothetical protein
MLSSLRSHRAAILARFRAVPPREANPDARGHERGQSLLEFVLVVPLLLLIFSGAADLGRAFYNQVALENAVKEGALYGARFPLCGNSSTLCLDPNTVAWRVQHETRNKTGPTTYASLVTPTVNECQDPNGVTRPVKECIAGDTYVVRATLAFNPITPLISNIIGQITLASESKAIVINQAFDPTPGLAPTKLVLGTGARNAAELASKCVQPDPVGSPGYYRSPCQDVTSATPGTMIKASFRVGDTITYQITVRNNGGTTVTAVTMDDSQGWPACPTRPTTMAVGGTAYTCTYSRSAPSIAGASADYTNVLTVTGLEIQPVTDTATVNIDKPPADLRVYKYVSAYPLGDDGDGTPNFGFAKSMTVGRLAGKNPTVYYKIAVQNLGGLTATGFDLTDTNAGAPPFGTATCPAKPSSLAAGATYVCIYSKTFSSDQVLVNTVAATASNVTPDSGDTDFATVTVASCAGSTKLVPYLIGLDKLTGPAAWTLAGFTGAYTNIANGSVVTQSQQAWSCLAANSTITVTKDVTP